MRLLPWQQDNWQQLMQQWQQLPHALLLTGPHGIGKAAFAEQLAASLLCERPRDDHLPCGACQSCHWMLQNSHPDFRVLRADEEEDKDKPRKLAQIKIEAVRDLIDFAHLSAHRSGRRVVMIDPADALNTAAANALLKILEEPPEGVHFLLSSDHPHALLPTLRSRCRVFPLSMPDWKQALQWLDQQGVKQADAELALAGGAPFALDDAELVKQREALLKVLLSPSVLGILDVAQQLDRARLPFAIPLAWLDKWLHDLAVVRYQRPARFYPNYTAALQGLAERISPIALMQFHDQLQQRLPFGQHTLNLRLQLEAILLAYAALFPSLSH